MNVSRAWLRSLVPVESRVLFGALGIVLSLWLFMVIAGLVTAGRTQAFDEQLLLALRQPEDRSIPVGPRWCRQMAIEITALGSVPVLLTFILAVAGYLVLERRFAMMGLMLIASISGMLLSTTLKGVFGRARPIVVPHLADVDSTSFPSGHSMVSAVVYLTLGVLLARTTIRWRLCIYYVGVALLMTFLIGVSRVYLGVHYPTDVMAGWAAGALWALVCDFVAQTMQRRGVVTPPTR